MFFEVRLLMMLFTNGEVVTIASITFGLIGSIIAIIAKNRQTRLETTVATTGIETKAKIDEASVLLTAYKDLNGSLWTRIAALEAAADAKEAAADAKYEAERARHDQTKMEKARLEGQLASIVRPDNMRIDTVTVDNLSMRDANE